MERKCSKCQETKNIESFTKDKRNHSGRSYECYECHRLRNQEYSKRMPDEVRKRKLQKREEYGKDNREKINKRLREKKAENSEKSKESARKYREANKEKMRQYADRWRKENWEKVLAQSQVQDHLKRGNIVRPNKCPVCKSSAYRIEAHHNDYDKPLEVLWLCQKCHLAIHQRINEEKRLSKHAERLSGRTAKADATVQTSEETTRERSEEVFPPLKNGQYPTHRGK